MWSIISKVIELLLTKLADWGLIHIKKRFEEKKKKENGEDLSGIFSPNDVKMTPTIIMGDRGKVEEGFHPELYKQRENIDIPLQTELLKKERNHNIFILSGRYASGKSRAIYELISEDNGKTIDKIYKPGFDIQPQGLIDVISKLPQGVLLILDDVNEFWERSANESITPEVFKAVFAAINDRNLRCIVTISDGTPGFQEFIDVAHSDAAKGRQKGKSILFLEIDDIEENDEVYRWCTSNFKNSLYSKVIGGYIPELKRYFDANIAKILLEKEAVLFLTSFICLRKFRSQKCSFFQMVNRMYEVIVNKEFITDAKPSFSSLYDSALSVLFDTAMLVRRGDNRLYIDDTSLFCAFEDYCTRLQSNNPILNKYLSGTKEAERNQIIRLIEMDGNDPVYYSRAITKCIFPGHIELVGEWLFRKFFEGSPLHIKAEYAVDAAKLYEISFASSLLIGRSETPITKSRQIIDAGICPDINMVSELLRAANTHRSPQEKREIMHYALDLKSRYSLPDTIYYLQMIEACEKSYSVERAEKVVSLFFDAETTNDEEETILKRSFRKYTKLLAQKADSNDLITSYFNLLKQVPGLRCESKEIKALTFRISVKHGAAATPLFKQLADALLSDSCPSQINEATRNIGIISILLLCKDPHTSLTIYKKAIDLIDRDNNPGDKDVFLYNIQTKAIMTYPLARVIRRLSSNDPLVFSVNDEIENRIHEALERNDIGAARKLFNALLNNQPVDAYTDSVDALLSIYHDKDIFPEKRDIDNLNSLFESAIRAIPPSGKNIITMDVQKERCENLLELAQMMDQLRISEGLTADGRYYFFMYKIIDAIQHIDPLFPTDSIHNNLIDKEAVKKNELLLCQEVRITNRIEVVSALADNCIALMKRGIIQTNLISHLIKKFCLSFPLNKTLGTKLNILVEGTYNTIRHNVHDYQHFLSYFLTTGKRITSIDDVMDFLDYAWTNLQRFGFPLREKNGDILCTVISSPRFDISETISLINFAIQYDRHCRIQDISLFHFDTLTTLARKFKQQVSTVPSDTTVEVYLDEIQRIIYTLQEIGYDKASNTMNMLKKPISKSIQGRDISFDYIRIPFESDIADIRHNALMQRFDAEGNGYFSTFELTQFIRQELFEINGIIFSDLRESRLPSPNTIGENIDFLMLALESAMNNNPDINLNQINNDLYIKKFEELNRFIPTGNNHFIYYANFFQGYLSEGYIQTICQDKWRSMEQFFFSNQREFNE